MEIQCPLCEGGDVSDFLAAPDRFHLRTRSYKLVRCARCACVWLRDPPAPEELSLSYSEDYHKAIVNAGEFSAAERWKDQRELISKYKNGGDILDVGCSSGAFLSTLPLSKWKLYGIEIAPETAEKARVTTGAQVFTGDVMQASFLPDSFDVITCFDVLEHVYNPRQFLNRVQEWLKPDGIFYVILPNIDAWESRIFGSFWFGLELPRHLFHFSPKSLRYIMHSLGFREVSIATPSTSYIERSANYVSSGIVSKLGFHPSPQSAAKENTIAWRAIRKALRLSIVRPFGQVASRAGAGASLQAVLAKNAKTQQEAHAGNSSNSSGISRRG